MTQQPQDPVEIARQLLARMETDLKAVRGLLAGHKPVKPSEPEDFSQDPEKCPHPKEKRIEAMGGAFTCLACGGSSDGS